MPVSSSNNEKQLLIDLEQMVAALFRCEVDIDQQLLRLEECRTYAKQHELHFYHARVLNALSLTYIYTHTSNPTVILETLHEALHYAQLAEQIDLQMRLLSNLTMEVFNRTCDVTQAERYIDNSMALYHDNGKRMNVEALFTFSNKLRCRTWVGDFSAVNRLLIDAWHLVNTMLVSDIARNTYVRGIFFIRQEQILADLAAGRGELAWREIELNNSFANSIYNNTINPLHDLNLALYHLVIQQDQDTYTQHLMRIKGSAEKFTVVDALRHALYLKHLGYTQQAVALVDKARDIRTMSIFRRYNTATLSMAIEQINDSLMLPADTDNQVTDHS